MKYKLKTDVKNKIMMFILAVFVSIVTYCLYCQIQLSYAKVLLSQDSNQVSIYYGQNFQVKAEAEKELYQDKIVYMSQDENIAKIDENGIIQGIGVGQTQIEVKIDGSKNVVKIDCEIKDHIFKIEKPESTSLEESSSLQLSAFDEIFNEKITDCTWTSSDESIATVENSGKVYGKKPGKVVIALNHNHKKRDEIVLNIQKKKIIKKITVESGNYITLYNGQTFQMKLSTNPAIHSYENLKFECEDNSVATVDEKGLIRAKKSGIVNLKIKSQNSQVSTIIRVEVRQKQTAAYLDASALKKAGISSTSKLMIVAHPDDETLWGGGHLAQGNWFVVCLTNGHYETRRKEFYNALNTFGAKGIILSYPDLTNGKRDNWSSVKKWINEDVNMVVGYKNWDEIVTHNPQGEYGHAHHKMTNRSVTEIVKNKGILSKLSYFGTYYKKSHIPTTLYSNLSSNELTLKKVALNKYVSQYKTVNVNLVHMVPYEYFIKAN